MLKKIFLLTDPVHSGKTSCLLEWSGKRNDVRGILTPVIEGKRCFRDIGSGNVFPMEAEAGEDEVLAVGRYVFSKKKFDKATEILENEINHPGWLVIDEAGPLELNDQGFAKIIHKIIHGNLPELKLILVVRDSLVEDIVRHFQIEVNTYQFINLSTFKLDQ
jgi:nucleoside-triphosphatase THEP1